MKKILLPAALSAILAGPSLADENDAMRQCIAFQMATGRYSFSDPQAPYQLLDACAAQWQPARLRVMRDKGITGETADSYMVMTLRDMLERSGH